MLNYTRYVCLKVLFRVQVAGVPTGLQLLDEQLVLCRDDSVADARKQLEAYAAKLASPYVNSDRQWVRWQFDSVLDTYESHLPGAVDFGEAGDMEVLSAFRRRRRRPDGYWAGPS